MKVSIYIIYLAECITCKQSDIGFTTSNLPLRLSNHKSHIKNNHRSCRLVSHFLNIDHGLDFSSHESYNNSLSTHLKVILIESVIFDENISKEEKIRIMESREGFWQNQLKTLERFGGLNTLDSNFKLFKFSNIQGS